MIMVDAYRQPYIPFYLTTKEFFELARDRLRPAAWWRSTSATRGVGPAREVLSATLRSVFAYVARDPVNATNTILMGSARRCRARTLRRRRAPCPPTCGRSRGAAGRLGPPLPAATSTPTTTRRSSGSSTRRSWRRRPEERNEYAALLALASSFERLD